MIKLDNTENPIIYEPGLPPERVFYRKPGENKWCCSFCGHSYTERQIKKMAADRLKSIEQIKKIIGESFGGKNAKD